MNISTEQNDSTNPAAGVRPALGRRGKRLLLKLTFSLFVACIALKTGDVLVGWFRKTPERHWMRLSPNAATRHQSTEFDYVFHTNSLGFRGPSVSLERPNETQRIVVIGDSFVAGVGVAADAVFTGKLQQLLRKQQSNIDVVNLGRSGSSTIREFDLYQRFGRRFDPQVVILVVFLGNDLAEITEEMTNEELAHWAPAGLLRGSAYSLFPNLYLELAMIRQPAAAATYSESDLATMVRKEATRRGHAAQWAVNRLGKIPLEVRIATRQGKFPVIRLMHACLDPDRHVRSLDPPDDDFEVAWPRVRTYLERIQSAVHDDGAELKIVVIPESVQIDSEAVAFNRDLGFNVMDEWRTSSCRTERALRDWTQKNEVAYLNLTDAFRASQQQLYHVWDSHLNEDGHTLTARILFDWLQPSLD